MEPSSLWERQKKKKQPSKAIVLLLPFLFNETLSNILSKARLSIWKFPFEPFTCFKAAEGEARCFDFGRCEVFHSTRSFCFSACQNFSSAFSPKTYLCLFFFFLKGQNRGENIQYVRGCTGNGTQSKERGAKGLLCKGPTFQTLSHLPYSHTKSRHTPSQNLAGTLSSPEVSRGSVGFDLEQLQGGEARRIRAWRQASLRRIDCGTPVTLGHAGCGGLLGLPKSQLDASAHQVDARETRDVWR